MLSPHLCWKVLNTHSSGRKIQGGRLENAGNSTKPQPAERSITLDGWCVDATMVNRIPGLNSRYQVQTSKYLRKRIFSMYAF